MGSVDYKHDSRVADEASSDCRGDDTVNINVSVAASL